MPSKASQSSRSLVCTKPSCSATASEDVKCSRCGAAYYCDRKHQFADLKRHKAQCANPAPTVAKPPRAPETLFPSVTESEEVRLVSVILFPASGMPAHIISMECAIHDNPIYHGLKEEWVDFRTYIHASSVTAGAVGPIRRTSQPHSRLYIAWSDSALDDGSPINLCIRRYTEGHSEAIWRGNLIGFRAREPTRKHMQYLDATDRDIAMFASFFRDNGGLTDKPDVFVQHFYDD
ncbi:hypothetical protein L226DRAFT_608289 [Lentinus tigrinus ALCF2SS1-7]|uniref:MYND-type domain-containing protein n=1 Tax=Lentinus tigrinus ALCF2SS1-6 TaxID=1328759 RepID=A0A5C2ST75_9APHY|nr:hypothetical protein L227DRAFT_648170 [Lentinus tigrinus ALCF2SS1-6]RPD80974.1 hypothetical protein L226DRAFT_608289 [Lentinus tigrinus ALCF2SS1-7]